MAPLRLLSPMLVTKAQAQVSQRWPLRASSSLPWVSAGIKDPVSRSTTDRQEVLHPQRGGCPATTTVCPPDQRVQGVFRKGPELPQCRLAWGVEQTQQPPFLEGTGVTSVNLKSNRDLLKLKTVS